MHERKSATNLFVLECAEPSRLRSRILCHPRSDRLNDEDVGEPSHDGLPASAVPENLVAIADLFERKIEHSPNGSRQSGCARRSFSRPPSGSAVEDDKRHLTVEKAIMSTNSGSACFWDSLSGFIPTGSCRFSQNPATLVTPTVCVPRVTSMSWTGNHQVALGAKRGGMGT